MASRKSRSDLHSILLLLTRSYWWFVEVLLRTILLFASRSLPACLLSRRRPLIFSYLQSIHDADVPRDDDSLFSPQRQIAAQPCWPPLTLEMLFLEVCLFSRCFSPHCEAYSLRSVWPSIWSALPDSSLSWLCLFFLFEEVTQVPHYGSLSL